MHRVDLQRGAFYFHLFIIFVFVGRGSGFRLLFRRLFGLGRLVQCVLFCLVFLQSLEENGKREERPRKYYRAYSPNVSEVDKEEHAPRKQQCAYCTTYNSQNFIHTDLRPIFRRRKKYNTLRKKFQAYCKTTENKSCVARRARLRQKKFYAHTRIKCDYSVYI